MEHLLKPIEAGKYLGVGSWTVLRYYRSGKLGGYRLNKRSIRFSMDQLETFIGQCRVDNSNAK